MFSNLLLEKLSNLSGVSTRYLKIKIASLDGRCEICLTQTPCCVSELGQLTGVAALLRFPIDDDLISDSDSDSDS